MNLFDCTQKFWLLAFLALGLGSSYGNDAIYPPAPAAKTAIDFDNAGFLINGQRTVIMSGSIHYPRIPHELWADRLLRLKRCNFNTVQTYAFWNYSEPRKISLISPATPTLVNFFPTAQELGLYATVRPGPYVCAEWDFGGFPLWLKFEGKLIVRSSDPRDDECDRTNDRNVLGSPGFRNMAPGCLVSGRPPALASERRRMLQGLRR